MRASRLVQLLLLLQARGGQTAEALARELEVSVRTVLRDVDALSASGVPIYAERGPGGGIRLVEGYRTRLTGMTADEAEALFLSGIPGPAAELGLGTVVAAAQLKVMAALPAELRSRASRLVERFHLDAGPWFQGTEPVPHLATVAEAVWAARVLEMGYRRDDETVIRTVEPIGIVLKAGIWYLVARIEGQMRTYRVSRIETARVLDQPFDRPPDFDLATWWAESRAAFEREVPRISIVVRVPSEDMWRLADVVGNRVVREAVGIGPPDAHGRQVLRIVVEWPAEAAGRFVAAAPAVEVLEPTRLRDELLAVARAAVESYSRP
ncbi:MAG: WYL domain-containing protein [Chloroflexi bacterium]|nr:WYL domain-containing protein [Chloroflexota bacterium]